MATTVAELVARLALDSSGFNKGLAESKQHLAGVKKEADNAGGGIGGFIGKAAGIIGVVGSVAAVGFALKGMVMDAAHAEQGIKQTEAVLKSTGGVSGQTAQSITNLSTKLMNLTGIDDDVIRSGENMLLTFTNIKGKAFDQASTAALDMATAMNNGAKPSAEQLSKTAIMLGKALNDPITGMGALHKVGVTLDDQQKKQIKTMMAAGDTAGAQGVILKELAKEFGGSASAGMSTFAGKLEAAQTKLGNMGKTIGGALLPVLSNLMDGLSPIMSALGDALPGAIAKVQSVMKPVFTSIGGVIKQVVPIVLDLFKSFASGAAGGGPLDMVKSIFGQIQPILKVFGDLLHNTILPVFKTLFTVIANDVMPTLKDLYATFVAQVLPAVVQLYAAIEPLVELIGNILQPVLQLLGWVLSHVVGPALGLVFNILGFGITVIADVIGFITHFGDVLGWLGEKLGGLAGIIGGAVGGALGRLGTDFNTITSAVGWLLGKLGDLLGVLGHVKDAIGGGLGNIGNVLGHIPGFAGGTDDAPGGLAVVHSGEVLLPAHSRVIPAAHVSASAGGGRGVSIGELHVHGDDSDSTARAVVAELNWQYSLIG